MSMRQPGNVSYRIPLHVAETGTANGKVVQCSERSGGNFSTATVQLTGISGEVISWEVTNDGTNWTPISGSNLDGGAASVTANANGIYRINLTAVYSFRARISTGGSGTVYATGVFV